MAKPDLAEKDVLTQQETVDLFVLSRRRFHDFMDKTDSADFLVYYRGRKLILRVAFEKYLLHHPELRRQV